MREYLGVGLNPPGEELLSKGLVSISGPPQVILVGDFFQLPPVVKGAEPVFAFEGRTWAALKLLPVHLQKVGH